MGKRLDEPNASGGTTDHSQEIYRLQVMAWRARYWLEESFFMPALTPQEYDRRLLEVLVYELARDLLRSHDESGISLDNWAPARQLVEQLIGEPITESGI